MCGIAGCLALAPEADPDQAWLTRALDRISHRGPDDDGVYPDADSNGAARGAAAPGLAPRLRGGRHAAPAAASEPAAPEQADPPAAPDDWFSPAMRSARRPGRHAAGGPDGPGVAHEEGALAA